MAATESRCRIRERSDPGIQENAWQDADRGCEKIRPECDPGHAEDIVLKSEGDDAADPHEQHHPPTLLVDDLGHDTQKPPMLDEGLNTTRQQTAGEGK